MGYERSTIMAITGARGSGKSLALAYFGVLDLMRGKTVWSNMPIKISPKLSKIWNVPKLESKPLDLDAFYTLDAGLAEGTICLDETQNLSDSRTSMSLKNRILNAMIAQVRKRSLKIYYTVQDINWVDQRLRFATDIELKCFDLAYSPWGFQRHIDYGLYIRFDYLDLSGYMTGKSYFQTYRPYKTQQFKGRNIWECYDSRKVTNLEEAFTSIELDLKRRKISNKDDNDSVNVNDLIPLVISNLRQSDKLSATEIMEKTGIEMYQWRLIKRLLPNYGIHCGMSKGVTQYSLNGRGRDL